MLQLDVVERLCRMRARLRREPATPFGFVTGVTGLCAEVAGLDRFITVGQRVDIHGRGSIATQAEVIGFRAARAQVLPLGPLSGIGPGTRVTGTLDARPASLPVSDGWLGRIVDPVGAPLDGDGPLPVGQDRPVRAAPPPAASRARLGPRVTLGVRALDLFATCRHGQRLGLFAGSGVGKSTLLAMLAHNAECDVVVLALVGERGREVREFIDDDLGPALARSVVVVATSDQPALVRREAAYAAMTIAEHFRDQGRNVLLLLDSVTRFCLALREVGLAAGEPPATRGYPPSMFAELPCLLERAGPGVGGGTITGLFTVLVEGDDHNEPVADAIRGILDGHVVLDRRIAEGGRYPAVDVLRSLSRTVPGCLTLEEAGAARDARAVLAQAAELADLVRLGAYKRGADPVADRALAIAPRIERLLRQGREGPSEQHTIAQGFTDLLAIMEDAHGA